MIYAFRRSIIEDKNNDFNDGLNLRRTIFDPLKDFLHGCNRVLIAPDGELTKLPFEVLPFDDLERRLIDDYHIIYLTVGRDLLHIAFTIYGTSNKPLVISNPDFELSVEPYASLTEHFEPSMRGAQSREFEESIDHFDALGTTSEEGEYIADQLHVVPWIKENALEGRLKKYECPSILHIATHGFFLANKQPAHIAESQIISDERIRRLVAESLDNPLLRSGLALAGANTWLKRGHLPKEAEDGILTAEEVSTLDLTNTQLVVLSACETGLGHIFTGERVFGFRRSFVLAGARTLVMSLWKVPSIETKELMEFYHRLLMRKSKSEALREAQLAMRKKSEYADPFYWGAFICQGDPGPLSFESSSLTNQRDSISDTSGVSCR
jgi:CHAT domain-containing protein